MYKIVARSVGTALPPRMPAFMPPSYPRDLIGYGERVPHARWPGDARIAVQFVVNYEEGGENSVLHGDPASETFLSEIVGAQAFAQRHMSMESLYEYGSRAGVWRVLRCLRQRRVPVTIFGVGMALERNPVVVEAVLRTATRSRVTAGGGSRISRSMNTSSAKIWPRRSRRSPG